MTISQHANITSHFSHNLKTHTHPHNSKRTITFRKAAKNHRREKILHKDRWKFPSSHLSHMTTSEHPSLVSFPSKKAFPFTKWPVIPGRTMSGLSSAQTRYYYWALAAIYCALPLSKLSLYFARLRFRVFAIWICRCVWPFRLFRTCAKPASSRGIIKQFSPRELIGGESFSRLNFEVLRTLKHARISLIFI